MDKYTISKDKVSGLWYSHMVGYAHIPVFGSFSDCKSYAMQYAKMLNGEAHKLNKKGGCKRWK